MATDNNRIDLSLLGNQNKIAVSLSSFFTYDELEMISLDDLKCPYDQVADHPCGCMEYSKSFDDGKEFQLHCIIDVEKIPHIHFISIRIKNTNLYQSDFKCNPNPNNTEYLAYILKRAINYQKFKNPDDMFYNKHSIIRNFSNKMIQDIGNNLDYYRNIKEKFMGIEENYDRLHMNLKNDIIVDYSTGPITVQASTVNRNLFKFSYTNTSNNKSDYCYLHRGHMGLNMLILAIDRSINKISIDSIDNNQF